MGQAPITVFGGTGFLGRAVVRRLAAAGTPVRVAARHPAAPAPPEGGGAGEPTMADVRDEGAVARAVAGAAGVVNAVGLYLERGGATFDAVHVEGAARVARLAREAGVERLVHVSGIGADPRSRSRYVAARGRGEARVREQYPGAVILRPSVLFGPGDAFLRTLASVTRLPAVPLFGDGGTRLQPVHVDDVAAAVARALEEPGTAGRTYELGGARVHSYRAIVAAVLAHHRRRRPLLPVPFAAWRLLAALASVLPAPPLTRDQVALMEVDSVVGTDAGTFADLGIEPRALDDVLAGGQPGQRPDQGQDGS